MAAVTVLAIAVDVRAQGVAPRLQVAPQRGEPGQPDGNGAVALDENVFMSPDRNTLQKLADARTLVAEGRLGEAVRFLGEILESPEDFFFKPNKDSSLHRSLKSEAQRLIGEMPREGRDLYELQYGARARQMLEEAIASGDAARLAEVSRRFFHTRAGYQAAFLLGLDHFEHGRPLAGGHCLQRLREAPPEVEEEFEPALSLTMATGWLRAGMPDKAQQALAGLKERHPADRVVVAGREVPMFSGSAGAVDWLVGLVGRPPAAETVAAEDWLMFRGDAERNAVAPGGAPLLSLRWRVPAIDDPNVGHNLEQREQAATERGEPMIPAFHPLAVGNVLLMRTLRNLIAVDFATGKRLWEVPEDETSESLPGMPDNERQSWRENMIDRRVRNDLTYGTLSSDGRYVFSVEDSLSMLGPGLLRGRMGNGMARRGLIQPMTPNDQMYPCNRLAAYEIRTGKLKWHLGGPAGQYALRQAEAFFLGPPLPLMGQLYVLAEIKGEIRLLALDAATGDLLWSQQLAVTEQSLFQVRCWAGGSPSYADGVLVCPTSAGAIVGVELATRSLLWAYQYAQDLNWAGRRAFPGVARRMMFFDGSTPPRHWADAGICIVDGRVLATPIESDSLHCLRLSNGEFVWRSPCRDDLFVACADKQKVVLVGRHAVEALRLTDGKRAWGGRTVDLPDDSMPSGRGFLSNQQYFLPLTSAEVVAIDLKAGKIAQVSKSRSGDVPGNLICSRGKVISLGLEGMVAYYQRDAALAEIKQRLSANPDDTEALTLRGETLLDAGQRSEAIASFERACELNSEPRTRELLREPLLEGLQSDFAAYRDRHDEVERLLENPAQRAAYLRLMARGLQKVGELASAFDYCQKLIDLDPDQAPLDQISKVLSARRDRWVRNQLAALRGEAKDETAARIDAAVETRWNAALAAGSIDHLQRFLDYFGDQPAAAAARNEWIARLKSAGRLLEAEMAGAGRLDAPLSNGADRQPGGQSENAWPLGTVEVVGPGGANASKRGLPNNGDGQLPIEFRGSPGPYFADMSFYFDARGSAVVARDGWGREQWRVAVPQENTGYFNSPWVHARACGHLLLVSLGWRVVAIDTLGTGANGTPRLLWPLSLTGADGESPDLRMVRGRFIMNQPAQMAPFVGPAFQPEMQSYGRSGPLGPLTNRYVCFQRFHSLTAVDPQTGAVLWVRQDVPLGSELFGDSEYVFVVSAHREEATLVRAADGEVLGTRRISRPTEQQAMGGGEERTVFSRLEDAYLAAIGRRLLQWRLTGGEFELALFDPLDGKDVWPRRKFSAGARVAVVEEDAVGVMEPSGQFVLISLSDGRTIGDVKLKPERSLSEITLFKSGDQFFLVTHGSPTRSREPQPVQNLTSKLISQGRLYAMNRQGRLQWPDPVGVKDQVLVLHSPARLPILAFASFNYIQARNGQNQPKFSVLCIDKRNGRTVYAQDFVRTGNVLGITGDAEKKTVDLTLQRDTVTLRFTDKPLPPSSAVGSKTGEPAGGKTVRAIWDSLQKAVGRIFEESEQEEDH